MSIRARNKVSVEFSMASMSDLVFLLLIFFIVLSTMVSPFGAKVDLPTGKARTSEHPKISVAIKPDLTYNLDGADVAKEDLEQLLIARKAEVAEPLIELRVDQTVPTGETVSFLSLAKQHGFNIVIATKPK